MPTRSTRWSLAALLAAALVASASLLPTPARAQATTVTTNETITFNSTVVDTCNGSSVTLTGQLHLVHHFTTDSNGGTHMTTHTNYQGVSGTGSPVLINYNAVSSNTHKVKQSGSNQQTVFHNVDRVRLISQGSADNLIINVTTHTTVNANGTATTTFIDAEAECNG
ncbi:MAG TPA: hypothetical protein VEQ42_05340 [Pyrinomonadaceae bacterium]|nr:hypothetical protein [Pyrinomonadaceae bacterium]